LRKQKSNSGRRKKFKRKAEATKPLKPARLFHFFCHAFLLNKEKREIESKAAGFRKTKRKNSSDFFGGIFLFYLIFCRA